MTLPFVLPYLEKIDLLKCSAVSKSWNAVVDACIYEVEDFESDYSLDQEQRIVLKLDSSDMTNFNENLYTNNEFGDKITGVNLVAFRHVDVTLDFDPGMWWRQQQVGRRSDPLCFDCKNLLKCLAHHGHLIRNFELELNGENVTTLDKLKLIQRCLTLTPNLRVLSFSDPPPEFANEDSDSDDENDERQLAAFNTYISENPWPKLEHLELLKCSAVSKSWNAVVDACIYEVEDFERDYSLDQEQSIVLKLDSRDMTDFNKRLSTNDEFGDKIPVGNPVAFRHVEVTLWFDENRFMMEQEAERRADPLSFDRNNLLKCLDHHGYLIRNFQLEIHAEDITILDKLKLIQRCLTQMPNLRVLSISASAGFADRDSDSDDENDEREFAEFNVYFSENPWPKLEQLKVLKFNDNTDGLGFVSIANAYAPQLACFQFGFELDEPHEPLTNRFSSLQKIVYLFTESRSAKEFASFMQSIQSPLKHLTIVFGSPRYTDEEEYNWLTVAANAASTTLETLVVHPEWSLIQGMNFDITKFEQLRLPKLIHLVMDEFGYPSLEFLQNVCPRLEHLTVTPSLPHHGHWNWTLRASTEIYGDLYSDRHFWNELANLESVDVEYIFYSEHVLVDGKREGTKIKQKILGGTAQKVYTRGGYEAKVEKDREMGIDPEADNQSSSSDEEEIVSMTRSNTVYKRN